MKILAEFKECPDCKVDSRLMNTIIEEEATKGNMGTDTPSWTSIRVIANTDVRVPQIVGGRIPAARVTTDICTKCGREFTTKIEVGHITIPARPGMTPNFS